MITNFKIFILLRGLEINNFLTKTKIFTSNKKINRITKLKVKLYKNFTRKFDVCVAIICELVGDALRANFENFSKS